MIDVQPILVSKVGYLAPKVIIDYNLGMARTLITVGKSTAVTIPPDLLERYGLKPGDAVELITTEHGITIVPVTGLEPAFENALRSISRERGALFQRLANHELTKHERTKHDGEQP